MRAVALLGLHVKDADVRRFELPGVTLFSGNELDPTDVPEAALIFGGDGTVHRHLGGLAVKQVPTLVVPIGSGNDFAQSIGVSSVERALMAWRRFCSGRDNVRAIDLGTIQQLAARDVAIPPGLDPGNRNPPVAGNPGPETSATTPWQNESLETLHFVPDGPRRDLPQMGPRIMQSQLRRAAEADREIAQTAFFACIAGTGLDAVINRVAMRQSRWLRGHGGYVVALMQTLGNFRPPRMTVSLESGGHWETCLDEPGFLVAAGNAPQYGHGMRLAHRARMDDGLLDLCFVRRLDKMRLLRLFRVVYRGGHIGMKEVEYLQVERLRLVTDPVMEVFADGEYICNTPVEIGVQREAMRVIVPA
jgi:diacylglycerol kinase family enzyme